MYAKGVNRSVYALLTDLCKFLPVGCQFYARCSYAIDPSQVIVCRLQISNVLLQLCLPSTTA